MGLYRGYPVRRYPRPECGSGILGSNHSGHQVHQTSIGLRLGLGGLECGHATYHRCRSMDPCYQLLRGVLRVVYSLKVVSSTDCLVKCVTRASSTILLSSEQQLGVRWALVMWISFCIPRGEIKEHSGLGFGISSVGAKSGSCRLRRYHYHIITSGRNVLSRCEPGI